MHILRTRHGIHFGRGHDASIARIVFFLRPFQPQFDHGRSLRRFRFGPGVHDGRDGNRVGIEFAHGYVV